jgi:carbon-monoxide dehydrogenase small subunit
MEIVITVNGRRRNFSIKENELLINLLRDEMHLTGTKYGCGIGECGACTVLLDQEPVLACMTLALETDGRTVETIENMAKESILDPIQSAFLEEGAVQCGFCTPGFIIMTKALLEEITAPTEDEIREYLRGNMCRCTGYVNIVKAVQNAAKKFTS